MLDAIIDQSTFEKFSNDEAGKAIAEHYKPIEGQEGYYIADIRSVNGHGLENNQGLKSALEKERSNNSNLQSKIKDYHDLDPVKAREAINKLEQIGNGETPEEVKAQIDTVKEQLTQKHKAELENVNKTVENLTSQLSNSLIDQAAVSAITSNFPGASVKLLLPFVRNQVTLQDDTVAGKTTKVVRVLNDKNEVRVSPQSGNTGYMTIEELITEMSKDKSLSGAFPGSGNAGSHSGDSLGNGANQGNNIVLNATEAKDPIIYRRAKLRAEKENKGLKIMND